MNINKEKIINLLDYYYYYEQKVSHYYIGIYSPDESISVILKEAWSEKNESKASVGGLNQILLTSNLDYDFIIKKTKNSITKDYALCYKLDNITGISLTNGIQQTFLFNEDFNNFTFSYPHTQKEKDINIILEFSQELLYIIKIYLNDFNNKILYYKKSINDLLLINITISTFQKTKCFDNNDICKVLIYLQPLYLNSNRNYLFNITVNTIEKGVQKKYDDEQKQNTQSNNENDSFNIATNEKIILVFLITFLSGLIIMIIFVIINMIHLFYNKDLYRKVEDEFGKKLKSNKIIEEEDKDNYKIIN